jgi:hypothetical protein
LREKIFPDLLHRGVLPADRTNSAWSVHEPTPGKSRSTKT